MTDRQQTSGSNLRQPHDVHSPSVKFSFADEREGLQSAVSRTSGGRTAKTLAKSDNLRVTLVQLRQGTTVEPNATAGAATLQVLEGRLTATIQGRAIQLNVGELLILPDNLREPLTADEDTTFLVTVAWEEGAGAWDQEEASGQL